MIRLCVPGSLRYRDIAVRVVSAACKLVGRPSAAHQEFTAQVVSAFGEAFNNIAIHGYVDRAVGDVHVEIEPSNDAISIRLRDSGASFDPTHAPAPVLESLPESGLGIYIMRSFVDEIVYEAGPPNVLSMKKYLNGTGAQVDKER
jgi:serine/threonine-protein kinase RsbW